MEMKGIRLGVFLELAGLACELDVKCVGEGGTRDHSQRENSLEKNVVKFS